MKIAFFIILAHYVGDFLFQTGDMATNKHNNFLKLLKHTLVYTFFFVAIFIWLLVFNYYFTGEDFHFNLLLFGFCVFASHTIIDYFTSKISHKKFENKEYYNKLPNFNGAFSVIGFDQLLHYATLFLIYSLLFI